ncbi:hypothetical protein R1flu_026367 [Riccia fluitans]|uniref:Uncharacterized protein n=1 Tax=Riccia fluitans TaxID=41844 RepID=A0ABD1XFR0_9MARC
MVDDRQDIQIEGRKDLACLHKPRICPESVEVPDVEAIFFGVETAARYFEKQEENTTTGNEDAKIDEDSELGGHSTPVDNDGELAADDCESRLAHDEEASRIPIATMKFEIQGIGPIDPSEYLEELAVSTKAMEDEGHFATRKKFPKWLEYALV